MHRKFPPRRNSLEAEFEILELEEEKKLDQKERDATFNESNHEEEEKQRSHILQRCATAQIRLDRLSEDMEDRSTKLSLEEEEVLNFFEVEN